MAFFFGLATMFLWGTSPLLGKLALARLDPVIALTFRSGVVTLCLLAWSLLSGNLGALGQVDAKSALWITMEGISGSLLGHLAYFYALKMGNLAEVIPVTAAYPLVAALWGVALLGDRLTIGRGLGALLVVIGVWLVSRS